jgi:sulfide:quinone oxidoreductase
LINAQLASGGETPPARWGREGDPTMKRISIIGAGFGALTAAKRLRRLDPQAEITLIAPSAEFVYLPSLIWVPTGLRSGDDLRFSLAGTLRRHRLDFHAGRVSGLADGGRRVITDQGEVTNDGLVIACGGRFIKKLPGIEHALSICESIEGAQHLRDRLAAQEGGRLAFGFAGNPNDPSAVRGGPMFELLFGVDTWLRRTNRRGKFEITFFAPMAEPGKRLGERAMRGLLAEMARRDIRTVLGSKLTSFDAAQVNTEGGSFEADLIAFMPGITGPAWAANAGLPLSAGGFFQADEFCRVQGADRVFVAGDAGSYPGPDWMPKQAHMADLQAKAAAANLLRVMDGQAPLARPKTELACIVDTLDGGTLVYRTESRNLLYAGRWLHYAKLFFEWFYLLPLRRDCGGHGFSDSRIS